MRHRTDVRAGGSTDAERIIVSAEEVVPIVLADAQASEDAGRMSDSVLSALHERRLFRLFIPKQLDGEELDLITALRVFELLSKADGAAGWTVMIGAGAGLFAGFLDSSAAAEIFRSEDALIAGSGAPTGVARKRETGYLVSGRWSYASGAHHATWFTANCVVEDGNGEQQGSARVIRSVAVPASEVRVHRTWSVVGMRGTGSEDIEICDCLVPFSHTFSVFDDEPRVPGPLYRFPFNSIAELSFASVALGVARHALEDFRNLAVHKRPMGSADRLTADPDVQSRFARAEAIVGSARAFTFEMAERTWDIVSRGGRISDREAAKVRLAAVDTVQRCAEAVDLLHARAGMTPLFSTSTLGRAWRDVHAITQNALVSAGLYVDSGRILLGRE